MVSSKYAVAHTASKACLLVKECVQAAKFQSLVTFLGHHILKTSQPPRLPPVRVSHLTKAYATLIHSTQELKDHVIEGTGTINVALL